ncbi:MAG: 16S rRNA (cytidine(1402)-2'-O)-methyltransferase [Bdellovibrionales bacterium]
MSNPTKKDPPQQVKDSPDQKGWVMPPRQAQALASALYLVATPIGNLGDISFRALDVLAAADVVYCEDTRHSKHLLSYFGLHKKLQAYHDHSDEGVRAQIVGRIADGQSVALISDAGMPLISDPGYKLVCDVRAAGLAVISVPGANAPLAALQVSGLPSDRFCFLGFLPSKDGARRAVLQEWARVPATLIAFETAPRLSASLKAIHDVLGDRDVAVVRELTKAYEEVRCDKVSVLIDDYEAEGRPKGEIVLVIGPPLVQVLSDDDIEAQLLEALQTMRVKDAAAHVAAQTGRPKSELYDWAVSLKDGA